jgi:uncharacterized protein YcbK (DUF882 family)
MNPDDKITKHITWGESTCKDGTVVPPEYRQNAMRIGTIVGVVRDFYGLPADINSWYRTLSYNAKVGGEPGSKHLTASAIDFNIRGIPPAEVRKTIDGLIRLGLIPNTVGIGAYDSFTHIDLGPRRRWKG